MRPVAHTEAEKNQGCRFRARSLRENTTKTTESVGGTYPHQHFVETICYAIPDNRRKTNACKKLAVGTHPTDTSATLQTSGLNQELTTKKSFLLERPRLEAGAGVSARQSRHVGDSPLAETPSHSLEFGQKLIGMELGLQFKKTASKTLGTHPSDTSSEEELIPVHGSPYPYGNR